MLKLNWEKNLLKPQPIGCKWRVVLPQMSTAGFFHGHIMLLQNRNQLLLLLLYLFFRWGSTSVPNKRRCQKVKSQYSAQAQPGHCCGTRPTVGFAFRARGHSRAGVTGNLQHVFLQEAWCTARRLRQQPDAYEQKRLPAALCS